MELIFTIKTLYSKILKNETLMFFCKLVFFQDVCACQLMLCMYILLFSPADNKIEITHVLISNNHLLYPTKTLNVKAIKIAYSKIKTT